VQAVLVLWERIQESWVRGAKLRPVDLDSGAHIPREARPHAAGEIIRG